MDTARKTVFLLLWLMLAPALCLAMEDAEITRPGQPVSWTAAPSGAECAALAHTVRKADGYTRRVLIHALRFAPERFEFPLFSSRWEGAKVKTMREWTEQKELVAAVNACMYQPDGLTATGYMRGGERINNGRIVKRYGAFFVSGPRRAGLPRAAVLDRTLDDWQTLLPLYDNVVQNFRLMGPEGEQLWPEQGPRHAVAAVAEDREGRILFLHCGEPLSVHEFVDALKAHPSLCLKSAMYVEGGSDASLMLMDEDRPILWNGMSPASYMLSSRGDDIPLPNIIGVRAR